MKKVLFSMMLVFIAGSMSAQTASKKTATVKAENVQLDPSKHVSVENAKATNSEEKTVKVAKVKTVARKEETTTTTTKK